MNGAGQATGQAWTWQLLDGSGRRHDAAVPTMPSRFDAELWLGEQWRALAADGAVRAFLVRNGEPGGRAVELRPYEG